MRDMLKKVCSTFFGLCKSVLDVVDFAVGKFMEIVMDAGHALMDGGCAVVCALVDLVFDAMDNLRGVVGK